MFTEQFYATRNTGADIVRALAILLVLLSHSRRLLPIDSTTSAMLTYGGWFGVEIFFVLSGFLIGGLLYKQEIKEGLSRKFLGVFLLRRWFRTLPAYFAVLLILFFSTRFDWSYLFFLQTLVHYNSSYPALFPVSWSLVVEEFFYLFLTLAALFIYALRGNKNTTLISAISLLAFTFVIAIIFHVSELNENYKMGWRTFPFRFSGLALGVMLAILMNQEKFLNFFRNSTTIFITIALSSLVIYLYYLKFTHLKSFFLMPLVSFVYDLVGVINAVFIVGVLVGSKLKLNLPLVSFIATLSYSLYLVHFEVLRALLTKQISPSWTSGVVFLMLSIFLAYILYNVIERPFMAVRNRYVR